MAFSVRFAALLAVAVPIAPVAAADGPAAVLGNYADIAQAMYGDALVRAEMLDQAVAIYRERFQPSESLDKPYIMLGVSCLAAPTDEEAEFLFTSQKASFYRSRTGGRGRMQPPSADWDDSLLQNIPHAGLKAAIVGAPQTVKAGLEAFIAKHQADELIIASSVYDFELRKRSYSLIAEAGGLTPRI